MSTESLAGAAVEVHRIGDEGHLTFEQALLESGVSLPLQQRFEWLAATVGRGWMIGIRDRHGVPLQALTARWHRSRALPALLLVRAERVSGMVHPAACRLALEHLTRLVRSHRRILRVSIELFSLDSSENQATGRILAGLGYLPAREPRCYPRTLLVDLDPSEEQLLGSFHPTARRHIRAAAKRPVEIRTVEHSDVPRLDALLLETLGRTGGDPQPHDWTSIIALSNAHPSLSRLAGLYRTDVEGPGSLVAFAWGSVQGRCCEYATAASTREADLKMPLGYPLAWDLMRWAKSAGCRTFDFGGVSGGSHGSGDPLGGISDFKRYFNGTIADVGAEWILEPSPASAALARSVSRGYAWLRSRRLSRA